MRALRLSLVALAGVAAVIIATTRPAIAQPGSLRIAKGQAAGEVEEAGYRYRRWRYRPYYRPYYGYYRPYYGYSGYPYYYRPYYRPWWRPGISFGFWF